LPSSVRNVVLLTMVTLLPVALLAAGSIELASNQVTSDVNKQVQTTAAVSAVVIGQTRVWTRHRGGQAYDPGRRPAADR
jgi:hypothetical protein